MVRHWLAAACYPVVYAPRSLFAGKLGTARHVVTQGVLPARPASLRLPASLDSDVDERYGRRRRMLECSLARSESLPGVAEERAPYLPAARLLDRVRIAIRTRHLSRRTELHGTGSALGRDALLPTSAPVPRASRAILREIHDLQVSKRSTTAGTRPQFPPRGRNETGR